MTVLTVAAVLALAGSCQSAVAPTTILKLAQHESRLDPRAVNRNQDGTLDKGLMQINERNFLFLALTDPFDPCQSIAAAARLLASFSRYNTGSPTKGMAYAAAVADFSVTPVESEHPQPIVITPGARDAKQPPPTWDVWATEVHRRQQAADDVTAKEDNK
jgi:type IV secretion system protein VirB1